jgi:tryptophan halogenase
MDDTAARREFALIRDQAQALAQRLPGQYAYLAHQQNTSTGRPASAA